MRHLVALALTVGVLSGSTVFAATNFSDVKRHWATLAIESLNQKNILEGYQDGTYRPNQLITREEFNAILTKALRADNTQIRGGVSELWAGYPNREAQPTDTLTRAEALSVLSRASYGQEPNAEQTSRVLAKFTDGNQVPEWAREAVAKAVNASVFRYRQAIRPEERITRGEAAFLVSRLLEHNEVASKPQIEIFHSWAPVVENQKVKMLHQEKVMVTKPTFSATVATALSSEYSRPGDPVRVILKDPLVTNDGTVLPTGTRVMGIVKEVRPANRDSQARLLVEFTQAVTPENQTIAINGMVGTQDGYLHPDSREVLQTAATSSFEGLKARMETEVGAVRKNHRNDVASVTDVAGERHDQLVMESNKPNFVRLGVGDTLEIKFDGASHYDQKIWR